MKHRSVSVCVIGGGIIGSWAALHLAEAGVDTLLLEQFPLPHTRGSSQGASRAFRYFGEETMDRLDYSMERWRALEHACGEPLFLRTGLVNFGPPGDPWLERHLAIARAAGKDCEWLDAAAIRQRFPAMHYPEDWGAAWDPEGGILLAQRCLAATQDRFRAIGGAVLQACASAIDAAADGAVTVSLREDAGQAEIAIKCEQLVVCAGPWTGRLLPTLRPALKTLAIPVTYWRDASGECDAARGFPIIYNARLTGIYALPACEYPGLVKVLYHGGPEAEPETRDVPDRAPWERRVGAYVREHLPALDGHQPAIREACMYTMTPDNDPVIDRLSERVTVGCGFSGSGFKHSPATGHMLAALALGREAELPAGFQRARYAVRRLAVA